MSKVSIISIVRGPSSGNSVMFGTGGSPGYGPAEFTGYVNTAVCVMDNGDTYIKLVGGEAWNSNGTLNYAVRPWGMKVFAGPQYFTLNCDVGHTRDDVYSIGSAVSMIYSDPWSVSIDGASGSATGYWGYSNSSQNPVAGEECDPTSYGFTQVLPIANWGKNEAGTELFYYVAGYINTNSGSVLSRALSMDAVKLSLTSTDNPEFFEYYPWQRMIEGRWMSLNRDGGKSTTIGLFRKLNGTWNPCTNMDSPDISKQHAFRYNNGWQRSPKSGEGA